MSNTRESNPHFNPHFLQLPDQRSRRTPRTAPFYGQNVPRTPHPPDPRSPSPVSDTSAAPGHDAAQPQPQPRPAINQKTRSHDKHGGKTPAPRVHFGQDGSHPPPEQQRSQGNVEQGTPHHRPSSLRQMNGRKTRPLAWLIAAFCALFWIIIIVGGLTVLIIYLVYRPRLPKFDISAATLNAAYLDAGYLLNADLTLLGNFTNPNKKVNVDFSYVILDLYHENTLIATRFLEPFTARKRESTYQTVSMLTSQVRLPLSHSEDLTRQINAGRIIFDVRGLFRARSDLGGLLKFSYWLYSYCTITVTGPPTGALVDKKCTTKR